MFHKDIDFSQQESYDLQLKKLNLQIIKVYENNEDPNFSVIKSVLADPYIINIHKMAKTKNLVETKIAAKVSTSDFDGIENLYKKLSKIYKLNIFVEKAHAKIQSVFRK